MAGRNNSLSLNTNGANMAFGQQQSQGQNTQQPPTGGSLFGGTSNQNNSTQQSGTGGGLFGGGSTQQQGQTGSTGLFGAAKPQSGGGMFGGGGTQQQGQSGSSLFGGGNTQQQGQGQIGSSLFEASTQQQPAQTSLFGAGTNTQSNQGGGLFGGTQTQSKPAGSLFVGNNASNTNNASAGTSLFGGNQANSGGGGIFGNANASQSQQTQQQSQQSQQQPPSVFGFSTQQPQQSMLNATQYRGSQIGPFAGRLTMGQQAAATQQATGQNPDGSLRGTTRFNDCMDDMKRQIEAVDEMVYAQESFCRQIEAFLPKHEEDVNTLAPDADLVREKTDTAEQALAFDAQGIQSTRKTLEKNRADVERCTRVVDNQTLKARQYHFPSFASQNSGAAGVEVADMDLVGNYFYPLTTDLEKSLATYAANLAEIESHMRVVEGSAVAQAQALAAKRNGSSGQAGGGEETIRELAETLRGFEGGILGAAGLVGECREGVNELVLGKLGGVAAGAEFGRSRW